MEIMLNILLITCALAGLSIQIAYASSLAESIKYIFGLEQPYKFQALTQYISWKRIIGNRTLSVVLFPFIFVLILGFKIHKYLSDMLSCPYCTGYNLSWITIYFMTPMDLIQSLIYGALVLIWVTIIERLM